MTLRDATLPTNDQELFLARLAAMDLQWFAAEDEGRTEDPTEHKIKKAREEGRVAKSQDLSSSVVLLFTVVALAILGNGILQTSGEMLSFYLSHATELDPVRDRSIGVAFMNFFVRLCLPLLVIGLVGGVLGNIIQVGWLFTTKPLKPDFKRIVPKFGEYFKRSFASVEGFYNLGKSFIKVLIIAGIAWANIAGAIPDLARLSGVSFYKGFLRVADLTFQVLVQSAVVLLAISFFDWWFQRRQHREALKMTPQEVKQERKEYDGDPLVKSRMRQRMRQILTQNMMNELPRADVVVTNPTHFAIALEYKSNQMEAPLVIAKGQDEIALKIREKARELGIPVIENKPLARALYAEVDIGSTIPPKFYEAVVVVLKQVYRMKQKTPRKEAV